MYRDINQRPIYCLVTFLMTPNATNDARSQLWWMTISLVLTAGAWASWLWSGQWSLLAGDASLFYYIGQQVGTGTRLYRDIWDHKPPLLFFLNGLGTRLTPGSAWGVWAVAGVMQAAGWIFFVAAVRRLCGGAAAVGGQAAGLLGVLCLLVTPNMTEGFSVGLQATIFALAWLRLRSTMAAVVAGAAGAALFQLRPNNAGALLFWLCWMAWALRAEPGRVVRQTVMTGAGFLLATVVMLGPLVSAGLWKDYIDAAFTFNFLYSASPVAAKLIVAAQQLGHWMRFGLLVLALAGAAAGWVRCGAYRTAAAGLVLWFLLEWLAGAFSAKFYHHYTVTMLVPAAALTALLGQALLETGFRTKAGIAGVALAGLAGAMLLLEASRGVRYRYTELASPELLSAAMEAAGPVLPLTWGLMPRDLWFRLNRPPATAVFHTVSFHDQTTYQRLAGPMLDGFLAKTPPLAIIRTENEIPLFTKACGESAVAAPHLWDTPELRDKKQALAGRYACWRQIGPFLLFRCRDCRAF